MNNQPTVIICGAGIGGLTVAHELARRGFKVTVYERNAIVGGLARSSYYTYEGNTYPVEYSWRVYGTHYKNLLRILSEIPLRSDHTQTVYNNLVKVSTFLFPREAGSAYILPREKGSEPLLTNFTLKDKFQILNKILFCVTMSEERMDAMDDLTWMEFCSDLSEEARKYVVRIWGPVLGMDPTLMSFPVVARMMKVLLGGYTGATDGLWVMNQPTNDGWFDEWVQYLIATGNVTIKTGHEIIGLDLEADTITTIEVKDLSTGTISKESADHVVCAMSVEAIANLVTQKKKLQMVPELDNLITLANISRQVQLSVQLFLNQCFSYPTKEKQVLYLPDTPWALIIEPEALIWEETHSSDPCVKSVLSVGICQTDVPGVVHNKPFTACTKEEVQDEVLEQMVRSYHTSITMEDGSVLSKQHLVLFYIWDSFQIENGRLDSWEPKFSNNAGSLKYQPKTTTAISNLTFATGYTRTDRYIYSMESATEAGVRAANAILTHESRVDLAPVKPFNSSLFPFTFLARLDRLLFSMNFPHLSRFFFGSSITYTIFAFLFPLLIVLGVMVRF